MQLTSHRRRAGTIVAAAAFTGALIISAPTASAAHRSNVTPVFEGLNGPRGVAVTHSGKVVFSEADGSFSVGKPTGRHAGKVTELGSVPENFVAPALDVGRHGKIFVLTAGGEPGTGAATLYRWRPGSGVKVVKDIQRYQQRDPDPYNVEGEPTESNPYGVAALPDGSALVADAAGNDLLRVYPNGKTVTVARIKPRVVEVPDELPDTDLEGNPLPPAGTPIPSEGVATSVTVGSDGYYYVGELRGFPATPGTSQVWRIKPGSVNAVCDPERPNRGACKRYADGFTSVVDLEAGPRGRIYVVELVQQSWLQWELGLVDPPLGGLFLIPRGGGTPVELGAGSLFLPGGVGVGKNGKVYVAAPIFGPGAVLQVRR